MFLLSSAPPCMLALTRIGRNDRIDQIDRIGLIDGIDRIGLIGRIDRIGSIGRINPEFLPARPT